jgi:dienelactone hydrolase
LLVSPESEPVRKPCVIVLHGTGGSKEGMRLVLRRLAKAGFVAIAIDGRYSGERSGGGKGGESYRSAILDTWKTGEGFPFLYDTVWDVMRLVDYLQTRSDVDPTRIGAIGFSKGGMELYLAAAVDPRIAVSVPCIGVQSFGWALDNNAWKSRIGTIQSAVDSAAKMAAVDPIDSAFIRRFYERVAPGIHTEFDGPQMLPLIAPRPLLVINGDRDDRTPRPGLDLCTDAARQAYTKAGAADQFEFMLQSNTGHAVTSKAEERAFAWLATHLRPDEKSGE